MNDIIQVLQDETFVVEVIAADSETVEVVEQGPPGPPGAPGAPGAPGGPGANGVGVPVGGSIGQILAKLSGADYATEWITPQKVYDAVVGPGQTYATIKAAVDAGKIAILVQGATTEAADIILVRSTSITIAATGRVVMGDFIFRIIREGIAFTYYNYSQLEWSPTVSKNLFSTNLDAFTGDVAQNSPVITNISINTALLFVGQSVIDSVNFNSDTYILSIDSPTQITVSSDSFNNATGAAFNGAPCGNCQILFPNGIVLYGQGTANDCKLANGFVSMVLDGLSQILVPNQHGWGVHDDSAFLQFKAGVIAIVSLTDGSNCYNCFSSTGTTQQLVLVGNFHPTEKIISPASGRIMNLYYVDINGAATLNISIGGTLQGYNSFTGTSPLNILLTADDAQVENVNALTGVIDVDSRARVHLVNVECDSVANETSDTGFYFVKLAANPQPIIKNVTLFELAAALAATLASANTYADGKVADNLTASTTVAPSKSAVNSALSGKQDALGFTAISRAAAQTMAFMGS